MFGLYDRMQRAGADIAEALGAKAQPQAAPEAPLMPVPALAPPPQPMGAPQGNLGARSPMQALPPQMRAPSPLQTMSDFRSPPVAAALQGAVGARGPVGFAKGGYAVKVR